MRSRREFLKQAAALGITPAVLTQMLQAGLSPTPSGNAAPQFLPSELAGAGKGKNVVILMLDALRPDYTQAYQADAATSPFFAELAKRSIVFDKACSTSTWTAPACASLFTGHYPPAHGIVEGMQAHSRRAERVGESDSSNGESSNGNEQEPAESEEVMVNAFAPDMKLLTEYLKSAGYTTFGLSTNPNVGPEIGFTRGFDRLVNMDNATADEVVDEVSMWQDELTELEKPYFLYLHFMDPHMPYHQREPWYQKDVAQKSEIDEAAESYRSEISYLDQQLAKLFRQWNWGDETLVILVSDHGEELGDHGKVGHRFQMHVELNRIMLMATGGGLERSHRVSELVGIHDLMPSILQWIGLPAPDEGSGLSLLPFFEAAAQPADAQRSTSVPAELRNRILLAHRRGIKNKQGDIYAVNFGQFRLLQSSVNMRVLYDHGIDPRERRNVSPRQYQSEFKLMGAALDSLLAAGFTDRAQMRPAQQSQADRDLLAELGYVGDK
jgi:arylsulfatase A-like enzyme